MADINWLGALTVKILRCVYLITLSVATIHSDEWQNDRCMMNWKDLEGSDRCLVEVLSRYLSGWLRGRLFSSPQRPDRLWGPLSLLWEGYPGIYPRGKAAGTSSWSLTSGEEVKNGGVIPPILIRLHGVVLDQLSTRKTSLFIAINLPVVLYGREIWFLTLSEEHRLRVWEQGAEKNICTKKEMKWQEIGENCIMKNLITCTLLRV
jgi:hypothetical protein